MAEIPFVNDDRCAPQAVRFTSTQVIIEMADGRILGLPLYFFPWLENATDGQRENYQLNHFIVDWEDMDEGIDLVAMLTGLYIGDMTRKKDSFERANAATT